MKDYIDLPPIIIERGEGAFLYGADGKRYIDIIGSWWCNLLGHCNPIISNAIKQQLDKLEHIIFANFSHMPAIELAEKLVTILPKGLTKFHFNDCGSASVEVALKMAFQYQGQSGRGYKNRFMCLNGGYHGETIGALSVGSMDKYSACFKPMLFEPIRLEAGDFDATEKIFQKYGKQTAALIIEPILQGASGMKIYSADYLKHLKKLCDKYNVILIADEIATGFGRTGKMFACDHANITPDIMCLSKGLTGGYLPFAITVTTDKIYDAFYADFKDGKAFLHSHTYSGNPLGCVASIAVIDILTKTTVIDTATKNAVWLKKTFEDTFKNHKNVSDIRSIGLINAIELVEDKASGKSFDKSKRIPYNLYKKALEKGLLLRPMGDVLYFNPPLNIEREVLAESVDIVSQILDGK
ncbi:MAG: adenosylmethionine--8-amino-7-oxononanoate transaminase [Firmicutes bacterium]|nr:adenosylmethionine--8-amino-7-oxononanoate transaminase [Bacillota bacterium]